MCRVKYANSLPDIPFDPKFITYPFDQHRYGSDAGLGSLEAAGIRCSDCVLCVAGLCSIKPRH